MRRCFRYITKWALFGILLVNFPKVPIFECIQNTFASICPTFFHFYIIENSLHFNLKLIFLTDHVVPHVCFGSKNSSFYRFFRATVGYLRVVQSCSYLMSGMISILTLWTKSIFDVQVTFIIIILGFSKIGPFFPFT